VKQDLFEGCGENANYREIRVGGIAPGRLYRSSHPIQEYGQDKIIARLSKTNGIEAVLNLSDTQCGLSRIAVIAPWYYRLYKNGCILPLHMGFDYASPRFNKKFRRGIQFIISREGPWLIHCHAGVDRSGFVCAALEALMGGTIREIIADYMESYKGPFGSASVSGAGSPVVLEMLGKMNPGSPVTNQNLQKTAEDYFTRQTGLSEKEIKLLKDRLA
jgi:hypothetical protein